MPEYIKSKQCVINNNENNYCRDTSNFLSKLATKLMDMAVAINTRMETIKTQVKCSSRGVLLAEIETPIMNIAVKYEYIEYIKRYGPPEKGIFDQDKLEKIRDDLGITTENTL